MPNRDGTGPMGQGPRTGGGWGPCPPVPRSRRPGDAVAAVAAATATSSTRPDSPDGSGRRRPTRRPMRLAGAAPGDRLESIEEKLGQVLARLDDIEAKGSK